MSERQQLLNWLYRVDLAAGVLDFDEVLARGAIEALGKDEIVAEGYVQANRKDLFEFACQSSADDAAKGLFPLLTVADPDMRRAILTPPLEGAPRAQRHSFARARHRPRLLRLIDGFSHRQYEALGCVVAGLMGADRSKLTPAGNEGGVDFFARLRQPSRGHIFGGLGAPIRLIGQSKLYRGRVGLDVVRDFITTIQDVRHQAPRIEGSVPGWFRDAGGPIVGWLIGHSGFQSGAKSVARNHGIVISNSVDLAETCAQSRLLCPDGGAEERCKVLQDWVDARLSES